MNQIFLSIVCVAIVGLGCASRVSNPNSVSKNQEGIEPTETDPKGYGIVWHWEDKFDKQEVNKIETWIDTVFKYTVKTIGVYPFKVHVFIHRKSNGKEPVPWANTVRGKIQGVHFHINPDFTLNEFLSDWTAAHEISHLSIPFVGSSNMWFSEGYASYMQVQIMHQQGLLTYGEMNEKYMSKFLMCKPEYQSELPMVEMVDSLKSVWNYPAVYWGGASFFYKLNRQLVVEQKGTLTELLQVYQGCCRIDDSTPKAICTAFDSISGSTIAQDLLLKYETQPSYLLFDEIN